MPRKNQPSLTVSSNPLLVKPESPYKVDLSDWKMGEFMAWSEAVKTGDIKAMTVMVSDVMVAWPHEGSPDDLEAYKLLTPQEWKAALNAVGEATGDAFR